MRCWGVLSFSAGNLVIEHLVTYLLIHLYAFELFVVVVVCLFFKTGSHHVTLCGLG